MEEAEDFIDSLGEEEKRHIEELSQRIYDGEISDEEFEAELKRLGLQIEDRRLIRCVRIMRLRTHRSGSEQYLVERREDPNAVKEEESWNSASWQSATAKVFSTRGGGRGGGGRDGGGRGATLIVGVGKCGRRTPTKKLKSKKSCEPDWPRFRWC